MYHKGECEYGLNNSGSSSSEEDVGFQQLLMSEGIPEGMPSQCFCGSVMLLQVELDGPQKGRRYYACCRTRPGPHFRRWWDETVVEEITLLKSNVQTVESDLVKKNIEVEEYKAKVEKLESRIVEKTIEIEDYKAKVQKLESYVLKKIMEIEDWEAKVQKLESRIQKLELVKVV